MFGYGQCNIDFPPQVETSFCKRSPLIKNSLFDRKDIGKLIKQYAEEEGLMSQSQEMLISSFKLQNGTLTTCLLMLYLELGLICTKVYRLVEYTPKKCFNKFVQSAVDARRQGDEKPNSSVIAETTKLLANSSYSYQKKDRSRHTVTKYLNDEKTHCSLNSKFFKKLDHVNHQPYEVELAKAEVEHKEPVVVGFFILQYANLGMLELYYNFFDNFVTSTNSKSWIWTQILCTLPLLRKNWPIVFDQRWKQNGRICDQLTVMAVLQRMHQETSSPNLLCETQKTWQAKTGSLRRRIQVLGNAVSF